MSGRSARNNDRLAVQRQRAAYTSALAPSQTPTRVVHRHEAPRGAVDISVHADDPLFRNPISVHEACEMCQTTHARQDETWTCYRRWLLRRLRKATNRSVVRRARGGVLACRCKASRCHGADLAVAAETLAAHERAWEPVVACVGDENLANETWCEEVARFIMDVLRRAGVTQFVSGIRPGFETRAAEVLAGVSLDDYPCSKMDVLDWTPRAWAVHPPYHEAVDEHDENAKLVDPRVRSAYLVDNAGLVVAAWDGKLEGHTWETIRAARREAMPVLHIDPELERVTSIG